MCQIYKFKNKKGFALPGAIFLLVFLAVIMVTMLNFNKLLNQNTTVDVLDNKAFIAAKSGIDYAFYQIKKNGICNNSYQTINLSEADLVGFKFSYNCIAQTSNELDLNFTFYTVNSIGCNTTGSSCPEVAGRPTSNDYVEKNVTSLFYN